MAEAAAFAGLALCRFVQTLAAMPVFGACVYLGVCVRAPLRGALAATSLPALRAAAGLAVGAALVRLPLTAAAMTGDPGAAFDPHAVAAVLTGTGFGRAWAAGLVLALALPGALFVPRASLRSPASLWAPMRPREARFPARTTPRTCSRQAGGVASPALPRPAGEGDRAQARWRGLLSHRRDVCIP